MADIVISYQPNAKQYLFHSTDADEAVYGGGAKGGKSAALVMDALAYALEYLGAHVYLFRESYPNLEGNLIREWFKAVPKALYLDVQFIVPSSLRILLCGLLGRGQFIG